MQHLGVEDGEQRIKVWNSLLKDRQTLAALVNQITLNLDMRKNITCAHELALIDYIVDKQKQLAIDRPDPFIQLEQKGKRVVSV